MFTEDFVFQLQKPVALLILRKPTGKKQFQIGPFSTNTRPEKSRTPPDRSATPYYVESF